LKSHDSEQLSIFKPYNTKDLECLVIVDDVFEMTPAIEAIINWALGQSGTHVLVTSRYAIRHLTTASCQWQPTEKGHIFYLTPNMMQLPDTTHSKGYALDKQFFMSIATTYQDTEVRQPM
jgi:hypothetical protein